MITTSLLSFLIASNMINVPIEDVECLALNIYHEARNQSELGQLAVSHVVLNRVASKKYPNTICKVIKKARYSAGKPVRNKCHFSWYCDGLPDDPKEHKAWQDSMRSAYSAYVMYELGVDVTSGSVMYHANYVNPYWKSAYKRTVRIDSHIFYKEKK